MIKSIQGLRVLFALMIFYHHFTKPQISSFGLCAVVAFFMISGFVMSAGYHKKITNEGFVYKDFIKKRISKLYPVHLLGIFLYLAWCVIHIVLTGEPQWVKHIGAGIVYSIPSFFLVQSFIPIEKIYFGGNAVAWFLSDMVFFYFLFPYICRHVFKHTRSQNIIAIIILLVGYGSIIILMPEKLCHPLLYINPIFRLLDFTLGIYLFKLFKYLSCMLIGKKWNSVVLFYTIEIMLFALVGYSLFIAEHLSLRYSVALLFWAPIGLLILFNALEEKVNSRLSVVLNSISAGGDYAMEFYLIHGTIIVIWMSYFSFPNWSIQFIAHSILLILIICTFSYIIKKKI